jgi:hypothetical protein
VYPDFKAFHRPAPDVRLASKKSHIEQNFYILKKNKRAKRTEDCDCQCAFCSISIRNFNSTQMRVHLTGESQGSVRVAPCKNVPAACKDFYLAMVQRMWHHWHGAKNLMVQIMWHHWDRSCIPATVLWVVLSAATNSLLDIETSTARGSWTAPLRHIVK